MLASKCLVKALVLASKLAERPASTCWCMRVTRKAHHIQLPPVIPALLHNASHVPELTGACEGGARKAPLGVVWGVGIFSGLTVAWVAVGVEVEVVEGVCWAVAEAIASSGPTSNASLRRRCCRWEILRVTRSSPSKAKRSAAKRSCG